MHKKLTVPKKCAAKHDHHMGGRLPCCREKSNKEDTDAIECVFDSTESTPLACVEVEPMEEIQRLEEQAKQIDKLEITRQHWKAA